MSVGWKITLWFFSKGAIHSICAKHTGGVQVSVKDRELFSDWKQSKLTYQMGTSIKKVCFGIFKVSSFCGRQRKRHLLKNQTHHLWY